MSDALSALLSINDDAASQRGSGGWMWQGRCSGWVGAPKEGSIDGRSELNDAELDEKQATGHSIGACQRDSRCFGYALNEKNGKIRQEILKKYINKIS